MKYNPNVFKKFDIRGIYPDEVNEEFFFELGRALADYAKQGIIVVGRGDRLSSKSLKRSLVNGIIKQGADVLDIGICTTPVLNFGVISLDCTLGAMVSASHNPSEYNGLKIVKAENRHILQFHKGNALDEIEKRLLDGHFKRPIAKGKVIKKDILKDYQDYILSKINGIKDLKIVVDYGNGVGAVSAKKVFESLPIDYYGLYEEPDGRFPNHNPDNQDIKNFKDLQGEVLNRKADIGIFFDGDADRFVPVNERGEVEQVDYIMSLFATRELIRNPNEKIYLDLRFSNAVKEVIIEAGGVPVELKVGNPFYKKNLAEKGGILAGESSGHIMFAEHFGIDDGLFASLKLLSIMSNEKKSLSELLAPFKKYYQAEEKSFFCEDPEKIIKHIEKIYDQGKKYYIDGTTIQYKDWWFNVRASQTQPLIRLTLEADTEKLMEQKLKDITDIIEESTKK